MPEKTRSRFGGAVRSLGRAAGAVAPRCSRTVSRVGALMVALLLSCLLRPRTAAHLRQQQKAPRPIGTRGDTCLLRTPPIPPPPPPYPCPPTPLPTPHPAP